MASVKLGYEIPSRTLVEKGLKGKNELTDIQTIFIRIYLDCKKRGVESP